MKNEAGLAIDSGSVIAGSCSPIPADRISELYNGEIFTSETAEIARQRIHWMCSKCKGKTVLDVGCSQGITAIILAREGVVVTGLDSHPDAVAYAQNASKLETKAVQGRLKWLEGDLWNLPTSEKFDTVVLGEVIEHQALPARFLEKAVQHLKVDGDGVVVLTTPFGLHPHPDHKVSLFPSVLIDMANAYGLQVNELNVVDGYIRMTFSRNGQPSNARIDSDMLVSVTERGTLASQASLFARLDERSLQLRKKNEAAKALQKRIDVLELSAKGNAERLKNLQTQLESTQAKNHAAIETIQIAADRLAAEKSALESKLNKEQTKARLQIEAAQSSADRLTAEKSALESKLNKEQTEARLQIEAAQTAADRFAAEIKFLTVKAQLDNERQTKLLAIQADRHQRTTASLENKVLAAKETLSFKLGNLLINSVKSLANFVRLPIALWNIYKEAKKRALMRGEKAIPELAGKSLDNLIDEYTNGGFPAVEHLLAVLNLKPAKAASAYTALTRHLQSINPGKAVLAARAAYQTDPQPFRAKWLAFRLFEAGVIVESAALLDSLPADIEFSPSETKRAGEIKSLMTLHATKPKLAQAQSAAYAPAPQSLLYVAASILPYHTSGYTTRTQALVRALSQSGIRLTVMTRPGYPWDRNDRNGTPAEQLTQVDNVEYHHVRHPSQTLPLDIYLEEAAISIAIVAKANRVAAIHAASNHVNALPALLAARQLGIPFHYEMRGLWELTRASKVPDYEESERFKLGVDLEAFVAKNADHVYVISPQLGDYIQSHWNVDSLRISILPNCINSEDFNGVATTAPKNFTLGYAGSLVSYEGLDLLIDAVKELARRGVRVDVKIIGDGESRDVLEQQVKDLGLVEQIKFLGKYSPSEARQALSGVNAICIPRKPHKVCEIIPPIKLTEAMALGKPTIVPDLPVMRSEVKEGVTGYFFKAGDVNDLADVIETCRSGSDVAREIGTAARAEVLANRTWLKFAENIAAKHGVPGPDRQLTSPQVQQPVISLTSKERLSRDDSTYVEIFRNAGTKGVTEKILSKFANNARDGARELLRVGKLLNEAGCEGAEYPLATRALEIERSEVILRGFFWAAQRNKEFSAACDVIFELEKIEINNPDANRELVIKKLKTSPAYLLSILKLVKPRVQRQQDPVSKRLCYILHNSLPYSSGGYGTRSHGLASGLKDAGYEVIVLTRPGFPIDIKPELLESETPAVDILDGIEYVRTFAPKRPGLSILEYISKSADAIELQLKKYKPEIVIAASNHVTGLPALIAARRLGIPFIYEVRGLWEITRLSRDAEFAEKPAFFIQKLLEAAVAKEADHVFTLTEPMREELIERGVASAKIDLLPNSCDPSRFVPRKRDEDLAQRLGLPTSIPVIGYIGTFVDYEGLDDLASACALLKRDGMEFRLLLVGNENASGQDTGPITEQIASIAESEGFSDWLIMPGRIPHDEVESYYSLLDVCPFPRKPLPVCEMVSPMKPLEALAMEKAVVVSSVRALVEMIDNERTGLVFEKGNIRSMADTFARLIGDDELRASLGVAGRKWVEESRTWRRMGQLACDIIEKKVSNGS